MKIIKHGTKFILPKNKYTCSNCHCVFEFDQSDCEAVDCYVNDKGEDGDIVSLLFTGAVKHIKRITIQCPECKYVHKLSDKYFISE